MADISPINGLKLDLPALLSMPPKLLPMITQFNNYRACLLEGGRGSGKSQSVARFLLYLGEQRKLRIVCGREIQANIEESVYTLLKDLIQQYNLAYDVLAHEIRHRYTGTTIKFKGFREQGSVNVKGLEGVDILWIDEAQSISRHTLKVITPTIRKSKARLFFTMNRFMRDDAVCEHYVGRSDCLHIIVNYFENPFCPLNLKNEAEEERIKSIRDYNHIWLGHPLAQADDYLFDFDRLHASFDIFPFGEVFGRQRVLGIDFAAQGNDQCVATILDRVSNQHWKLVERIPWDDPNTMSSVGKIVDIVHRFKPNCAIIDIGGMGKPVYDRLIELKQPFFAFDGGSTQGIDTRQHGNIRSAGYHKLKDWFDSGFLCLEKKDMPVVKELEKIKREYHSNGVKFIQPKVKMKKELKYSPDNADSLMMAVWCAVNYLGKSPNGSEASGQPVRRVNNTKRTRN